MVRREHPGTHERVRDRRADTFGEASDVPCRAPRSAACQDQRPRCTTKLVRDRRCRLRCEGGRLQWRRRDHVGLEDVGGDVHRQRDQHRAGSARQCEIPGARQDARDLVGARDAPGALDERLVHGDLVGVATQVELLVGPASLVVRRNVTGDDEKWNRVERGGCDTGGGVRHARTDVEQNDAWTARGSCVAVGGMRRDLLVASRDEARRPLPLECREEGDVGVAAEAEDAVDATIDAGTARRGRQPWVSCHLPGTGPDDDGRVQTSSTYRTSESVMRNLVGLAARCQVYRATCPILTRRWTDPTLEHSRTMGHEYGIVETAGGRATDPRAAAGPGDTMAPRPITPEETAHVDDLVARGRAALLAFEGATQEAGRPALPGHGVGGGERDDVHPTRSRWGSRRAASAIRRAESGSASRSWGSCATSCGRRASGSSRSCPRRESSSTRSRWA